MEWKYSLRYIGVHAVHSLYELDYIIHLMTSLATYSLAYGCSNSMHRYTYPHQVASIPMSPCPVHMCRWFYHPLNFLQTPLPCGGRS